MPHVPSETLAVGPTEAAAAAVVDVDDAEAATGPELHVQTELSSRHGRRAAMNIHDQRRAFALGPDEVGIRWRVVQRVRRLAHRRSETRSVSASKSRPGRPPTRRCGAGPRARPRPYRNGAPPRPRSATRRHTRASDRSRTPNRTPYTARPAVEAACQAGRAPGARSHPQHTRRPGGRRPGRRSSTCRTPTAALRTQPPSAPVGAPRLLQRRRGTGSTNRCDRTRSAARRRGSTRADRWIPTLRRPGVARFRTDPSASSSACHSSQPSHGMRGWFQVSHTSCRPSGLMRGLE